MSGHSKWASIKHAKGIKDARKGAQFSKLARLIAVAARGGGDPEMNFKLRLAVDQARAAGMPKDNIERSIAKGSGADKDAAQFQETTYEIYGAGGVAIMVDCVSDNSNRTLSDIKAILNKYGAKLGAVGSVAYLFDKKGVLYINIQQSKAKVTKPAEEMELEIIELGAEDVKNHNDEVFEMVVKTDEVQSCKESLENKGYTVEKAGVEMVPKTTVTVAGPGDQEKNSKILEQLEELDDVVEVYTNEA